MAYQENNISSLDGIPPLVATFAAGAGWTVGGTAAAPTLTHPTDVTALTFTLATFTSGVTETVRKGLRWNGPTIESAYITSPRRGVVQNAPTSLDPTKVFLFGGTIPTPYLAIVIAYGFNLYRHLYFGHVEKIGNYGGGEVVSGTHFNDLWASAGQPGSQSYRSLNGVNIQYLFCAWQSASNGAARPAGGVRIVHADNPNTWRVFQRPVVFQPHTVAVPETTVLGGFSDEVNDGYLARAKSGYAGSNVLVPINLFAGRPAGLLSPIGRPPAVRLVHMQDLEPESEVIVGASTWKCFPAMKKSSALFVGPWGPSFPTDETSYYVGQAYRKD